jgi:SAM-dependent methyltransferase
MGPPELGPDALRNRAAWDRDADAYRERNAAFIERGLAWGLWQIPESELRILGDVAVPGADVLELGCGEAEWSRALARAGARPVGLDVSPRRLELARAALERDGLEFPLVESPAETLPFDDASFDLVLSDWGATNFADPYAVVPEVARVLRAGGLFAFSGSTPLEWVAFDAAADTWSTRLERDWFGLHRRETPDGSVEFTLTHAGWIGLFREHGLAVERLVETRPPERASSTYRTPEETAWARRFPMEQIWVLRRQ